MDKISKNETSTSYPVVPSFEDSKRGGPIQHWAMLAAVFILPLAGTYALAERPAQAIEKQAIILVEHAKLDVKN